MTSQNQPEDAGHDQPAAAPSRQTRRKADRARPAPAAAPVPAVSGFFVLYFDDDSNGRAAQTASLRSAGFIVREVSPAAQPAETAVEPTVDVVLLGAAVSGADRFAVCRGLRRDRRTCDIPIVCLSATCVTNGAWPHGDAAEADEHLIDPVDPAVLVDALRRSLTRRRREAARARPERRAMAEAWFLADQRPERMFMGAPCGIYTAARSGQAVRANSALVRMLGYDSEAELCAVSTSSLFQSRAGFDTLLAACRSRGSMAAHDVAWRARDGRALIVRLTGRALAQGPDFDGGFDVFVEDVTDVRRLEVELQQARKVTGIEPLATEIAGVNRETLLVVDDDPAVLALVSTILTRHGYRVVVAGSAATALALVAAGGLSIGLVVTDVVMPEMNGPSLMEQLKAHGCTRVVYISGYPRLETIDTAPSAHAAYLSKPFTHRDLLASVRHVIGNSPADASAGGW